MRGTGRSKNIGCSNVSKGKIEMPTSVLRCHRDPPRKYNVR